MKDPLALRALFQLLPEGVSLAGLTTPAQLKTKIIVGVKLDGMTK